MRRTGTRPFALLAAVGLVLVACGDDGGGATEDPTDEATPGGDGGSGGTEVPDSCEAVPLTMAVEAFGDHPAGAAEFEVVDAVVRRVPILLGVDAPAADAEELEAMQARAAESPVALYSLYVADFEIDRSVLEGYGFGDITPPPGGTIGVLSIVPPTEEGLAVGDVIDGDAEIAYETTTTFGTLGLMVLSDTRTSQDGYSAISGQVEVEALGDDVACLAVDVSFLDFDDQPVSRIAGTVVAPVVHADPSFFFT